MAMQYVRVNKSALLITVLFTVPFVYLHAQESKLSWSVFNAGFADRSTSGPTRAIAAAGQIFVGLTKNSTTKVMAGFFADTLANNILVSVENDKSIPLVFSLSQNYPNPFNPTTTIKFEIPHRSEVEIRIYNVLGQLVRTLMSGQKEAGNHSIVWDGRNNIGDRVSTGTYFYQIRSGDFVQVKKMLMLK